MHRPVGDAPEFNSAFGKIANVADAATETYWPYRIYTGGANASTRPSLDEALEDK